MSKAEGPAIGIDLGTTYSCVGVWQHDRCVRVARAMGWWMGRFFSAEAAISMMKMTRDDGNGGERDDGRAVVGGDATRDAREGTRGFFCVCRSVGRPGRGQDGSRSSRDARGVSAATARDLIHRDRARETR